VDRSAPLIIITGPTGCGKTDLVFKLAQTYPLEVISADSMQVYRYMDIATAKPTLAERQLVPHHLVDIRNPDEPFDAGSFAALALEKIPEIRARGKIPMVVGGTGLYIQALIYDLCQAPPRSENLRRALRDIVTSKGAERLWAYLARLDPPTADKVGPQDVGRLIRYLEIILLTGQAPSTLHARHGFARPRLDTRVFCLNPEREVLYTSIDARVLTMFEHGLVRETEQLLNMGYRRGLAPMDALAYKHICACLDSEISLDEAVRLIQRDTRHYAKRQITWNRGHYDPSCFYTNATALEYLDRLLNDRDPMD
jgi:tRNA dimethylallyltransferase